MGGNEPVPDGPGVTASRFAGRSEFQQRVRDALVRAGQEDWREIIVADATFEDWPLGERAVADALQAWSRSGRRFVMLAMRYDEVLRRHARFVTWRRTWSHIIECWACSRADPTDFPSAIWSPTWALVRIDPERSAGVCTDESSRRLQLHEALQEWQRKSTPGFPATTLGL